MKTLVMAMACLGAVVNMAWAQVNGSEKPLDEDPPFVLQKVTELELPWRMAPLADGRMLITEKPGRLWLVTPAGKKTEVTHVPEVRHQGQGGLLGVYLSPKYADDQMIYLTYAEPQERGSGLALARARLEIEADGAAAALDDVRVIWRDAAGGSGGQFGGAVAFSPDGQYLFLAVGERQRMTPAQDPSSPLGKILRLTLDGQTAPENPQAGELGDSTLSIIRPPRNTELAKTAQPAFSYRFDGPNETPAQIWTRGHRNPYGLAFDSQGRLWELEHGPRGGDELNLLAAGKNYGWPLVSYGPNYDGTPIDSPATTADFTEPAIYWTPVIAPGGMAFYDGPDFPQWQGSLLISGLGSRTLSLVSFDAQGQPLPAARWPVGHRMRDVAVAADGSVWMIEDSSSGGLYKLKPKK